MNADQRTIEDLRRTIAELRRQIDAIRRIAASLSTTTRTESLVTEALDLSLELANADAGSILLYDTEKKKLVFQHVVGEKERELTGVEIDPSQGIAGVVFETGQTSISHDVDKDEAHSRELDERTGYRTTNMVTVALKSPDREPLGVMQILNKRSGDFDPYDVNLIETMAAQIAVAIEASRLYEQARLGTVVRFIGNISHDVKNMITPTVTGAETLKMMLDDSFRKLGALDSGRLRDDPAIQPLRQSIGELGALYPELISIILEGCNAVQERVAEISAAVKGIVSKPYFEPADVLSIARRVGGMLSAQAQKKGVEIVITSVGEVPLAEVDGKQVYNAIYNLLFNAIEACDKGDSVTFRVFANVEGRFPEGNCILMECKDTGPGMPENVRAVLFTDHAISTKPMGTGLGTRIVKNVIDAHGGTVEVDSELGVGTTIRCRIPISRARLAENSSAGRDAPA